MPTETKVAANKPTMSTDTDIRFTIFLTVTYRYCPHSAAPPQFVNDSTAIDSLGVTAAGAPMTYNIYSPQAGGPPMGSG